MQGVLEEEGISTVSISLLREVTEKVKPPRALFVPYPLGFPLGEPNNAELQRKILVRAFELLSKEAEKSILEDF